MRNIRYIGTKPVETAFKDDTGIEWTPGMVETVLSEELAVRMLKFTDVFQDAGNAKASSTSSASELPVVAGDFSNPVNDAQGRLQSYVSGGRTYTITYDAQGRFSTISDGTKTQTMTYNPDGSVASFV